ncbi:MAG: aminotransferase class I/II-fold pyridoxal phosphate-dependent enzyme [Lachnospiraceae bacterium]|nr:aminotransferase class I/II-fold pyridoxal phosphate-dependent enzyme [Lachnospiraceae bacterium]
MSYEHGGNIYKKNIDMDFSVSLNPLGCPKEVKEAVTGAADRIFCYPDPAQNAVRSDLSELCGVGADNVICTNGASELIMAAVRMVKPKKALLTAPSFYGYEHALKSDGNCEIIRYVTKEEKGFSVESDVIDLLTDDIDMFFLANPNNPTGKLLDPDLMERIAGICEEKKIFLVIDECFLRLSDGGKSMAEYAMKHEMVLVVDAFTKLFAIPGVRFGYGITSGNNTERLERVLPEWNVSVFAEAAAAAGCRVLMESSFQNDSNEYIKKEREFLGKALTDLGFRVFDSDTLFFMFCTDRDICGPLQDRGILIRDCSNFDPLPRGHYRTAVRTHEENVRLAECLKTLV